MRRKETIAKVLAKLAFSKQSLSQLAARLNEECLVIAIFLSIMYVYLVISPYIHGSSMERKKFVGKYQKGKMKQNQVLVTRYITLAFSVYRRKLAGTTIHCIYL